MSVVLQPCLPGFGGLVQPPDPTSEGTEQRAAILGPLRPKRNRRTSPATQIYAGSIDKNERNAEVRGPKWYGDQNSIGVGREMLRDGHVRKSVDAIVDPLLAAHWDFVPPDRNDPIAREVADSCRWAFLEESLWEAYLRRTIVGYVRDGFKLEEVTEAVRPIPELRFPNHPGGGLAIVPDAFHDVPSYSVEEWIQQKRAPACLDGIAQLSLGSDVEKGGYRKARLSRGDLLHRITWDQEGADFEGFAPLRSVFFEWKQKRILQLLDAMRHELEGKGIPTLAYPENPSEGELGIAKKILRQMHAHESGYIELPFGFSFKFTTTGGQSTGIREAIEVLNRDIAYNMGVAWMLLGSGKTGSWALATEQRGQYALSLEKHARLIEVCWNLGLDGYSPVRRFVALNWGHDAPVPRLVARNLPTKDWSKILPLLPSLVASKVITASKGTEDWARMVTTMPPLDEEGARESPAPAVPVPDDLVPPPDDEEPEDSGAEDETAEELEEQSQRVNEIARAVTALAHEVARLQAGPEVSG